MAEQTRSSRAPMVKNRAPAKIQITAEQLLREAQERQEPAFRAPQQNITSAAELADYQSRKRTEFEERIRYSRWAIKEWIKYAVWETQQGEWERGRSVWERTLEVDPRSVEVWQRYAETELKGRNVNHARNVYDRAVTLLPRVDALWYKYVYLEELLLNVPGARQVFERWMTWEPDDKAWGAYIKLEERYSEHVRASALHERWIACRPIPKNWVVWAKFEEDRGEVDKARDVFQTALEFFGDAEEDVEKAQGVFGAFARMETRLREYDRARTIYKYALARLPRSKSANLYTAYTRFEKQHGDRSGVELTVLGKRRIQYEEELAHDPTNYDAWFSLARLEEDAYRADRDDSEDGVGSGPGRVRETYERAVANVPPASEKRFWRRYIYLWLQYAAFEEIDTEDFERARDVYKAAIKLVPHKQFTFAKLWAAYSAFEIRRLDIVSARKVFGAAIGICPKPKLFVKYIEMEIQLREFDRCRTLYQKFLEFDPSLGQAWIQWTELETSLGDVDRARGIFELAVQQALDMPELVWKAFIDFEAGQGERERTRVLYERLLERTAHVKVYISYALMEASKIGGDSEDDEDEADASMVEDQVADVDLGDPERARKVFERGNTVIKENGEKEDRVVLLEAWKTFEQEHGTAEQIEKVQALMPKVMKKWRQAEDGSGLEEYWELVFPDTELEANPASFKFFQAAQEWSKRRATGASGGGALDGLDDDSSSDESDDE